MLSKHEKLLNILLMKLSNYVIISFIALSYTYKPRYVNAFNESRLIKP